MRRPTWIAFDLNGTLLDPAALLGAGREEMGRAALEHHLLSTVPTPLVQAPSLAEAGRQLAEL